MSDTLHHRYRGEDLDRYRVALYAQAMAARDGLTIPDALLDPGDIEIEWTKDNRPRAVVIRAPSFELRVIVTTTATATIVTTTATTNPNEDR